MPDATSFPATAAPGGTMLGALMTMQFRNMEALARAHEAALDGMGSLARQQQDMLAAALRGMREASVPLLPADPRAALVRPLDSLKSALIDGTANANLLGELAARAGAAVAGILQDRMAAALDELKAALLQAMPAAGA